MKIANVKYNSQKNIFRYPFSRNKLIGNDTEKKAKIVIPRLQIPKCNSIAMFPIYSSLDHSRIKHISPLSSRKIELNAEVLFPKLRKYENKRLKSVNKVFSDERSKEKEEDDYAKEKQYEEYERKSKLKKIKKIMSFPKIKNKYLDSEENNKVEVENLKTLKVINKEKLKFFKQEALNHFYKEISSINKLEHVLKSNIGSTLEQYRSLYNEELDSIQKSFLFSKKKC